MSLVVSPGTIVTPGYKTELGLSDEQIEQFKVQAAATTPLGRTGTPDFKSSLLVRLPRVIQVAQRLI